MSQTQKKLKPLPYPDSDIPVVFLDVDGVLNCKTTRDATPLVQDGYGGMSTYRGIEKAKVDLFEGILARAGANWVWSSSWRTSVKLHPYFWEKLGHLRSRLVGITPRFRGQPRGNEIKTWLQMNPHVKRYVILDDFNEMGSMRRNQILTNPEIGLDEAGADEAYRILSEQFTLKKS